MASKVIKWTFRMLGVLSILIVIFHVFTLFNKAYWDAQIDILCSMDGGVTVYERVDLRLPGYAGIEYSAHSNWPLIRSAQTNGSDAAIIRIATTDYQGKFGGINIIKRENRFVRVTDNKMLSKSLVYERAGGDSLYLFHPSSHICEGYTYLESNLVNLTFEWE